MAALKPGLRLSSAVCDGQIMVLQTTLVEGDLTCGGQPMRAGLTASPDRLPIATGEDRGLLIGKRYVDSAGRLEVLCVRQGAGTLSFNREPMLIKEAKQLPASD
jgi:hypothetical protein